MLALVPTGSGSIAALAWRGSSGIMILAIRMPPGADMKLAASR